jgi:Na+/H+ antiporter NhaD/arsenite permease-like protein
MSIVHRTCVVTSQNRTIGAEPFTLAEGVQLSLTSVKNLRNAMMHLFARLVLAIVMFTGLVANPVTAAERSLSVPSDVLVVFGTITNSQGNPIKDAELTFFVNGRKLSLAEDVMTSTHGTYEAQLELPAGALPKARVEVMVERPSYESTGRRSLEHVLHEQVDGGGNRVFLAHFSTSLVRALSPGFWIAAAVLIGVYTFIAFELLHRTLAALVGAAVILVVSYTLGAFNPSYRILSFEDAMHAIDQNVIFLLMAMMIIVGITKKTGVFQWMAYKSFQIARGNIFMLTTLLMFVTAVVSALLDNVTTMLLLIPVTIEISVALKLNPVVLLIPEVFASNVGGTATLVGDPPNIMIGSYAQLTFMNFVENLTIVCLIGLAASIVYYLFWFRSGYLAAKVGDVPAMIARLREEYRITNPRLLIKCGIVLAITIFLFVVHGALGMEPSIAAMAGAAILLVISDVHIVEMVEKEVEWPTLIFFMMLFIVVAGAEETGLIQIIAEWVRDVSHGSLMLAIIMILWVSAIASAIIDNIPFTATMLPIVAYLTTNIPGAEHGVLWWALALGACLGGNGTIIGASANVVTVGMAEKAGYPITFMAYLRMAFLPMLITVAISMVWLLLVEA